MYLSPSLWLICGAVCDTSWSIGVLGRSVSMWEHPTVGTSERQLPNVRASENRVSERRKVECPSVGFNDRSIRAVIQASESLRI